MYEYIHPQTPLVSINWLLAMFSLCADTPIAIVTNVLSPNRQ